MDKLFDVINTGYDPKNREVFIARDGDGQYFVYKPRTGFKSRGFKSTKDKRLKKIFDRQLHCSHNQGSYLPGEAPGSEINDITAKAPAVVTDAGTQATPPELEPVTPGPVTPPAGGAVESTQETHPAGNSDIKNEATS